MTVGPRFLATIGRAVARGSTAPLAQIPAGLRPLATPPGLSLWVEPDGRYSHATPDGAGLLVGWIGGSDPGCGQEGGFWPQLRTAPEAMLEGGLWGWFAAVFQGHDGRVHVARDAMGGVDLFALSGIDHWLIGTHPADLLLASGRPPHLDWTAIRDWLRTPLATDGRTGLEGLAEIPPGGHWILEQGRCTRQSQRLPRPARLDCLDRDAAVACLRQTVRDSLRQVLAGARRIGCMTSGGFDSSTVLAMVQSANNAHALQAITLSSDDRDADERFQARLIARHVGVALTEIHVTGNEPWNVRRVGCPLAATASRSGFVTPAGELLEAACQALGLDLLLTGEGGDQLFHRRRLLAVARDVFADPRWRPGIWQGLREAADLLDITLWQLLMRLGRSPGTPATPPTPRSALLAGVPTAATTVDAPAIRERAPGKRQHVADILACRVLFQQRNAVVPLLHPLLVEPIVSLCLALPTHVLTMGGRERGLARQAFAGDLPPSIARRRGKGATQGYYHRLLARHHEQIRASLLEGALVARHVLDRQALEAALRPDHRLGAGDLAVVFQALAIEAWVADWTCRPRESLVAGAAAR